MEINEILSRLRFMADTYALIPSVCLAAKHTIEEQQKRIAELEAERDALIEGLRYGCGCDSCKYRALDACKEPCYSCKRTGGKQDNWEWRGLDRYEDD